MTYCNQQPAARNVSPPDLADGTTHEQSVRDFDERYEVEYLDNVEYEVEGTPKPDVWTLWARGWTS